MHIFSRNTEWFPRIKPSCGAYAHTQHNTHTHTRPRAPEATEGAQFSYWVPSAKQRCGFAAGARRTQSVKRVHAGYVSHVSQQ